MYTIFLSWQLGLKHHGFTIMFFCCGLGHGPCALGLPNFGPCNAHFWNLIACPWQLFYTCFMEVLSTQATLIRSKFHTLQKSHMGLPKNRVPPPIWRLPHYYTNPRQILSRNGHQWPWHDNQVRFRLQIRGMERVEDTVACDFWQCFEG